MEWPNLTQVFLTSQQAKKKLFLSYNISDGPEIQLTKNLTDPQHETQTSQTRTWKVINKSKSILSEG